LRQEKKETEDPHPQEKKDAPPPAPSEEESLGLKRSFFNLTYFDGP
jgi:hypothetical protein